MLQKQIEFWTYKVRIQNFQRCMPRQRYLFFFRFSQAQQNVKWQKINASQSSSQEKLLLHPWLLCCALVCFSDLFFHLKFIDFKSKNVHNLQCKVRCFPYCTVYALYTKLNLNAFLQSRLKVERYWIIALFKHKYSYKSPKKIFIIRSFAQFLHLL